VIPEAIKEETLGAIGMQLAIVAILVTKNVHFLGRFFIEEENEIAEVAISRQQS